MKKIIHFQNNVGVPSKGRSDARTAEVSAPMKQRAVQPDLTEEQVKRMRARYLPAGFVPESPSAD